jgi:hypothetical protein
MLTLGLVPAITAAPTGHSTALVHESTVHETGTQGFSMFCVGNNDGCWPSSYLIGTQKGGTTAIAQFLVDNGLVLEATQTEDSRMSSTSGLVGQAINETNNQSAPLHDAMVLKDGYFSSKETHALDQFFVDNAQANSYEYTRLYRPDGKGTQRSFLDATPNYLPSKNAPRILHERMPDFMRSHVKFVAILREPISRALSWYNHVRSCSFTAGCDLESLGAQCYRQVMKDIKPGTKPTFDATVRCAVNRPELGNFGREDEAMLEYGYYAKSLETWTKIWQRKNMLILSYDKLDDNADATLELVIKHYGLPKRKIVAPIEHLNTQSSPNKIEVIQCSTLATLHSHYFPHNDALYRQLAQDRNSGKAPDLEEPFSKFVVDVPCAEKQIEAQECWTNERKCPGVDTAPPKAPANRR